MRHHETWQLAGALQYVPELTWILFLRILDEKEQKEQEDYEAVGIPFTPSIEPPYRWQDWASSQGKKYKELKEATNKDPFFSFVNGYTDAKGNMTGLLPYLKNLKNLPNATPRQKVISEILSGVEHIRIDTEKNFLDVVDKVDEITSESVADTHVFTLSQVYEGLLLKMGEKGNDGGQFFTPREIIRVMVQVIAPEIDETVYDPGCGTGGFLAQTFEYIRNRLGDMTANQINTLKNRTFWGREKDNIAYPIALANLILHGLDKPNIWHGNTLTDQEIYGGLFEGNPRQFDVILTNPPFGGKEGKDAQTDFDYKTGSTQVLFLQHVLKNLKNGGRCGIVVDEGLLFRTNEDAFVKTKRKLLDECDLFCIVSLPGGVFTAAGAGVKTNLLFFKKGEKTKKIWYYDLSDIKVGKKTPLTLKHFEDFFVLLPAKSDSEQSWTIDIENRRQKALNEALPFKDKANHKQLEANLWKDKLSDLKKIKSSDKDAIAEAENRFKELTQDAKELLNKAKEIEDAVYDLKAVNPNKKSVTDSRTPKEIVEIIESKGKEISEALAILRISEVLRIR